MLGTILGLVGVGGIGAALFFLPGLRIAIFGFLKGVPPKVWYAIGVLALLGAGYWYHGVQVKKAYEAAYSDGVTATDKKWQSAFDKMREASATWKGNYERAAADLSSERRKRHEEAISRNAVIADALRVSGPGRSSAAAYCRSQRDPGLPASTGDPGAPAPQPDAPGPGLPDNDRRAIVPWDWLTRRAQEHDDLLEEVTTWRAWHPEQAELLRRHKLTLPEPTFGLEEPEQ